MPEREQQQVLQEALDKLIDSFYKDRERHKRLAAGLKAASVALAGLTTAFLGFKSESAATTTFLANVALFLAAAVTVLNGHEAFSIPALFGCEKPPHWPDCATSSVRWSSSPAVLQTAWQSHKCSSTSRTSWTSSCGRVSHHGCDCVASLSFHPASPLGRYRDLSL